MYCTGIDLHKRTCFVTTIDKEGKIVQKANLPSLAREILAFLEKLGETTQIVIESSSSWYWLYDALSEAGENPCAQCPTRLPSPGNPAATQARSVSGPDHSDPESRQGHAEEAAAHGLANL